MRTLRGERVALDVDGAATVARLKGMVMAREGVAADAQRLFFAGRHLDDDALPLAHYGVRHGSVVFLSLRLRAGEDAGGTQYVLIAHCTLPIVTFMTDRSMAGIQGRRRRVTCNCSQTSLP